MTDPTTPTPAPAPAPTAEHHANLSALLQILLHLAPAIAAPFIKSQAAVAVFNAEAPIVESIADALAASKTA